MVDLVESEAIKLLMMIRDPGDIVVSYYEYVTEIDLTHNAHKYFFSLPDDDSRLMAAIQGVDGIVSPIFETLSKFEGWLTLDNVLVVRFEDLIGQSGGGDGATQGHIVESLAKYLEIDLNYSQIQEIKENIYSTKTLTFRSGKTGNWGNHFMPHHVEAFKKNAGELLVRYGYEENNDW